MGPVAAGGPGSGLQLRPVTRVITGEEHKLASAFHEVTYKHLQASTLFESLCLAIAAAIRAAAIHVEATCVWSR
jgi:hypothetical protein